MPRLRSITAVAVALLSTCVIAACGSNAGSGEVSQPAPPASAFPSTDGRSLQQVLASAGKAGPIVSPGFGVLHQGQNRFSFAVFRVDRTQVKDAEVAIYAARGAGLSGKAIGPFPARIEDITTEEKYRAQTTANDPDAATVVYVADVPLDQKGKWAFGALVKNVDGSYGASVVPTPGLVGQFENIPQPGDKAPIISTPTVESVGDVSTIDTRIPPSSMHEEDFANVVGRKPVVLLFATPQLCQSRVCGPVVDVAEQTKAEYGDRVAFIHMEVYRDNDIGKGLRPQVAAYHLPTEPWLFVIDRSGDVSTVIEGPFSVVELKRAVAKVAGG